MFSFDSSQSKHPTFSLLGIFFGLWLLSRVVRAIFSNSNTTPLRGPPNKSFFFGVARYLQASPDNSLIFEQWAKEYGSVYRVPFSLGSSRVILADPKAVAAFYARETSIYVRGPIPRRGLERLIGRGLLWAEGESHKRQRKALNPAFNNAAIRKLIPVFFDSAYKTKAAWDALIDASQSGEASIDVQSWMNHVSLDTIGIAGFSHDFRTLNGEQPDVQAAFESFNDFKPSFFELAVFLMAPILPILDRIPTASKRLVVQLNASMKAAAVKLLTDSRKMGDQKPEDKSIMGLLLQYKDPTAESQSTSEEVLGHMRLLLVAGYETTSIALTWALVELAQRPDAQTRLREELAQFSAADPTWDQLTTSLPYLDAVVHEILRLHPPVPITGRVASRDDVLPLSTPITTSDGKLVNSLAIAKGTTVQVTIPAINRSEAFWGPDAKEFKPERWLADGDLDGAKEIQGHRHLLTFSDGPRTCLGKGFALAEFKAVLCTLIKNFCFELPEGAEIETSRGLLPRPRLARQNGLKLPLRVRRVE